MIASMAHLWALFGIGFGVIVILAVILSRLRAKTVGISVLLLMMMAFAGAATFMFMPARRFVPPIPDVPGAELPPVSLEVNGIRIREHFEDIEENGDSVAEIARTKIQAGAEAMADAAQRVAEQTQALVRQHNIPPIPQVAHRVVDGVRRARPAGLAASGLMAFAMGAFLYLGYIFLDASTRGHFTWSLRIVSVVTFAALCLALSILRHGL